MITGAATSSLSSSSISSLRAVRHRFASTLSLSPSTNSSYSPTSRIFSAARSQPISGYRFSPGFRSICSSSSRWSHGVDWRSPVSLRAQIATATPTPLERFQRRIATMGTISFHFIFENCKKRL